MVMVVSLSLSCRCCRWWWWLSLMVCSRVGDSGGDSLGELKAQIRSEFSFLFVMVVVVFLTLMVAGRVKVMLTCE